VQNPLDRPVRWLDAWQQRTTGVRWIGAVVRKFSDDRGGQLAAIISYYTFLAIFPLMLLGATILGIVLDGRPDLQESILNSAVADFPILGQELRDNLGTLTFNGWGTLFSVLLIGWAATGFAKSLNTALTLVWDLPPTELPNWWVRTARSIVCIGVVFVATALAGVLTQIDVPVIGQTTLVSTAVALLVNSGAFVLLFRLVTPKSVNRSNLTLGAVIAGVGFTFLTQFGAVFLANSLARSSQLYGFFGIVLGALGYLYLVAQLIVYAAEINVVRARKLVPRNLID
jgi:inner membrane protein YhjD